MSRPPHDHGARRAPARQSDDPYAIIAYLLAGMIVYGGIGWGLDRWLGTDWIVAVGLVLGTGLALWVVYLRFGRPRA